MTIDPPGSKILLHVCCAPCSGAIIEALAEKGFTPTVFWSNSNIYTAAENAKRLEVLKTYAAKFGVPVVEDEYDHAAWLAHIKGLENEPERGARCLACFKFRLLRAARYGAAHGFDCLTTSLASSRWKSLDQVNSAGLSSCPTCSGISYWAMNWRKGGLQPRRNQIIKEQNFYNQTYCGCEFSLKYEKQNEQ